MTAALSTTIMILKLRIGSFIALAAVVGIITGGGNIGWTEAAVFTLAVLGASGAAGGFNHYFDREIDQRMKRTAKRPFATGALRPGAVWPATFAALLLASLVMAWSVSDALATLFVFLGAFTYAVVYTVWLKMRTVWNVVIGGAAGSFALLAGAVAAAPQFEPPVGPVPLILSVVLFLWTPAHFWALAAAKSDDYRRAGIPMLPAVTGPGTWAPAIFSHIAVLAALSLAPLLFGMGPVYGLFAASGGWIFLVRGWRLLRNPGPGAAMATFIGSLYQFSLLSLGVVLDGAARWAF
jgi:protoheme IX farnesyltransferase